MYPVEIPACPEKGIDINFLLKAKKLQYKMPYYSTFFQQSHR